MRKYLALDHYKMYDREITTQQLRIFELNNADSFYPWSGSSRQLYYNFEVEKPFPFAESAGFIGGVMIEVNPDKILTTRVVYSFTDWFAQVGGFVGFVRLIFIYFMRYF